MAIKPAKSSDTDDSSLKTSAFYINKAISNLELAIQKHKDKDQLVNKLQSQIESLQYILLNKEEDLAEFKINFMQQKISLM